MSTRTSPTSTARTSPQTTGGGTAAGGSHHHHHHHSPTTRSPGGGHDGGISMRVTPSSSPVADRTSPGPFASPVATTATTSSAASLGGSGGLTSLSSSGHRTGVRPQVHAFQDFLRSKARGSPPPSGITAALLHTQPTAATYGVDTTAGGAGVSLGITPLTVTSGSPYESSPDGSGGHRRQSWSRNSAPSSPLLTATGSAPPASPGWPGSAASRDRHLAEVDDEELWQLVTIMH